VYPATPMLILELPLDKEVQETELLRVEDQEPGDVWRGLEVGSV